MNGHSRAPTVFWAFERGQGREQNSALVLILMSDWCGFGLHQINENPDATAPSTAKETKLLRQNHNLWADILLPLDAGTANE